MLDYYFENLNKGRPFILAGHSQEAMWIQVVLEDYIKNQTIEFHCPTISFFYIKK